MTDRNDKQPPPVWDDPSGVRTALIIAAGMGSRLENGDGTPKPLTPVLGMPMIQRIMATAAKAGIRRFVVVIGYQAGRMRETLPELVPAGCTLEIVENPRYRESNGISLLAGARRLAEPFVLLMSDHLFSRDRLIQAISHFTASGRCLLGVDARETFDGDIADATRVAVEAGKVLRIGKNLETFHAIDTGMFVLQPEPVIRALEQSGSCPGISDGMAVLAAQGELDALLVSTGYWQDIDTPEDLQAAESKLFRSLVKPSDGILARLINRRISLYVTGRIWRLGITPHMVTAATLVLGILAGVCFAQGTAVGWGLLGAALFQLQSILDGVDGELARLMHRDSRIGFWLDVGADNLTHMAVFGGIAVGNLADGIPGPWVHLGIASVLGVAVCFAVTAPLLSPARKTRRPGQGKLHGLVDRLSRRDFTYLLFPLAVFGWLGGFLWAAAVGTWAYALAVLYLRIRSWRASSGQGHAHRE